jgi:radical SAM superfamily enzyme YgiQ (UPF0313 family)
MSRKLLLVNPVNSNRLGLSINLSGRFPPLGLGIVAALTPADWEVELIDENFGPFTFRDADLVGLTSFTASITRAYEIADVYRKRGIPTVIGGIHASMLPREASKYVDTVVIGEVESVWRKVLGDFEKGKLKKTYRGQIRAETALPGARHDLFHPDYVFGSIQTARGCPMDCEFCSVSAFNGRRYRQRDVESVLDELETIRSKLVYFVDDNLYGYGKSASERALRLFRGIIERGIKKDWFTQASINFAENDEVLKYAARSGCRMVLLGLEAENAEALEDAGKHLNLKRFHEYEEVFRRIRSHGIAVLGSFIYGMDSDTPAALKRRTEFILNSDVDAVQMSLMTPLPGTRLFAKLRGEGRLLYTNFPGDWVRYDMTEVLFKPRSMEPNDLFNGIIDAGSRVYNPIALWCRYLRTLGAVRNTVTAWWAYSTNLNYLKTSLAVDLRSKGFPAF